MPPPRRDTSSPPPFTKPRRDSLLCQDRLHRRRDLLPADSSSSRLPRQDHRCHRRDLLSASSSSQLPHQESPPLPTLLAGQPKPSSHASSDHLIVFLLYPKYNEVNVLDSLDKDSKTYQEFLRIIDLAFKRGIISEADNAKTQENAYSSSISGRVTSNRWEQYYADITVVSS
ncbi:uncharacterized protein [Oryza sativa Japonica Group]|uniref:uncharacterized protein n=1 Tax=Oryza sativa subsp. japonica TaxID=39947 RepID=UPI000775441C|nr:uncharacterized protein LOC107281854 [Oryza sativa Japonica Group]